MTANRFVSKAANKLKTVDDLKGKTVVSTSGTTNIKQITEINAQKNLGMNILTAKDHAEAFLMVETDRAVAFVMDDILLYSLVASSKVAEGLRDFGRRAVGRALRHHASEGRRGLQEGRRWRDDRRLQERRDQQIYEKWFLKPIPPKDINLNRADGRGLQEGRLPSRRISRRSGDVLISLIVRNILRRG